MEIKVLNGKSCMDLVYLMEAMACGFDWMSGLLDEEAPIPKLLRMDLRDKWIIDYSSV